MLRTAALVLFCVTFLGEEVTMRQFVGYIVQSSHFQTATYPSHSCVSILMHSPAWLEAEASHVVGRSTAAPGLGQHLTSMAPGQNPVSTPAPSHSCLKVFIPEWRGGGGG